MYFVMHFKMNKFWVLDPCVLKFFFLNIYCQETTVINKYSTISTLLFVFDFIFSHIFFLFFSLFVRKEKSLIEILCFVCSIRRSSGLIYLPSLKTCRYKIATSLMFSLIAFLKWTKICFCLSSLQSSQHQSNSPQKLKNLVMVLRYCAC